jgi:tape measure domain-containing protein
VSVDIGKISVTFAASTEGFSRGVGSATAALQTFAKNARDSGKVLSGAFGAQFGDTLDALTGKLNSAALSGEAFGAAVASAFGRASKAVDAGASGSLDVLVKQMEVGTVTGEEFATAMSEVSARASDSIDSIGSEGLESLASALDAGKMNANDFADSVTSIAAGEAGAGIENMRNEITALDQALKSGAVSAEEFLGMQQAAAYEASSRAAERQSQAIDAIRQQFDLGTIGADKFTDSMRTIQTSFRIEAIAEYETQMESLRKATESGSVSEEQFADIHKRLTGILQDRVVGDLERQLRELPDAFEAAGASAEELAAAEGEVNKAIEAGEKAVENAVKRQEKSGENGGLAESIMGGLEKVGSVTALIPGELGHVGHSMENIVHVGEMMSNAIGGLGPEFSALAGPIGIAAGAALAAGGALMHMVESFGTAAREAKRLATQFGLTTKEVAALQTTLSHIGSSTQEFNKVSRILQGNLTRASDGSKAASAAFKRLGIDAKEVRFEQSTEQVEKVIVALARIQSPAERSMLAVKLLGKTGAEFAAKFGTDVEAIKEKFHHAEQATERFKHAFSDLDTKQLVKALADIEGIEHATSGLGSAIAAAFAPLMGGLASGISDLIGSVTNIIQPLVPIIQVVGAVFGETARIIGSAFNAASRIFSAAAENIYTALSGIFESIGGGVTLLEAIQGIGGGVVAVLEGIASWAERIRDNFKAWMTGKTVEDLQKAKKQQEEMASLGEAAVKIQEKYGDKTEEIREKIEEIKRLRETMDSDGKPLISAEEAGMAMKDLNKQLEEASPYIKMMTDETHKFEKTMKSAGKEAGDMGNNIATDALRSYRAGYEKLLEDLKKNPANKELFDKGIEGLAEKFNKEMEKAKPIKAIADQINELKRTFLAAGTTTGGAGVVRDFQKFDEAQKAGAVNFNDKSYARLGRLDAFAGEMGLGAPKLEGIALFDERMQEIDKVAEEVAKHTGMMAEEEATLAEMRLRAIRALIEDSKKLAGNIGERQVGPAEKAVDDLGKLNEALEMAARALGESFFNGDAAGQDAANAQIRELQERQARAIENLGKQNKFEGGGEKAAREFDESMKDIERARAKVAAGSPEAEALDQAEKDRTEKLGKDNLDLIDKVIEGTKADKRAATGIDANSQEGVSTYFRILRSDNSMTQRQLEESRQMKILLRKIADNTNAFAAAGL